MIFSSFLRVLVFLVIVILGPIFYSSISWAQINPDQVINRLDANYYYPHKKGLVNKTLMEDLVNTKTGEVIEESGMIITDNKLSE